MKFLKNTIENFVGFAAIAAGIIIGYCAGMTLYDEKIEPWMMEKLHKENEK